MRLIGVVLSLAACAAPAPPVPTAAEPVDCAAADAPAADAPAAMLAVAAAAPESVADIWHWRCCNGRYTGGLALSQEAEQLRGIFLADEGMGTYVDGTIQGRQVVFTRRWLNAGRPFSQIYTATLSPDGRQLEGSFVETHAPGPAIGFSAERRFQPDLHDFNPLPAKTEPVQQGDREASGASDELLPLACDCARACGCSGIPKRMECHYACGCPACPQGIPRAVQR